MPVPHRIPLRRWRPPRVPATRICTVVHAPGSPALLRSGRSSLRFFGPPSVAGHAPAASSSRRSATRVASSRVPGRAMTHRTGEGAAVSWPDGARGVLSSSFAGLLPPAGGPGVVRPCRAHVPFPTFPAPTVFAGGLAVLMVFCPKDLTRGRWLKKDGPPRKLAAASGLQFPHAVRARQQLTRRRRPILPWASGPLSGLRTLTRGGKVATSLARRPPGPASKSPSAHGFGSASRPTTR
jgi:hypothetical protein